MVRRGRKRAATESPLKPKAKTETAPAASPPRENEKVAESEPEERQRAFNNQEVILLCYSLKFNYSEQTYTCIVERRIAAIQAIQAAEVQSLISRLHLLRSYFSKEQLEKPALQFFQENLPNISPIRNDNFKVLELKWKDAEADAGNMPSSVDISATTQLEGRIPASVRSVKSSFLDIANLQIPNFVLDDLSENQVTGMRDAFQTPTVSGNKLSFGMTPKTKRQPKNGEMLMSVRGSPLGVYKEDNLEAIHESWDGSHDGISE